MSIDLSGSFIEAINDAVQVARGAAASVVGQTYNVYRLRNTTSGQIVSGSPLYTGFPAKLTHWTKPADIENDALGALLFAATCDNTYLEPGDVFVGYGYGSDLAMYVVADERPLKQTILVRCEQAATVTRPASPVDTLTLNAGRPTIVSAYAGVTKNTEQTLILTNGLYSFATSGTTATVPFGLQPKFRLREMPPSKLPTDTRRENFIGFLPVLPGIIVEENDVISSGSAGDRYRVEQNYISEYGLQGQILVMEKLVV